LPTAGPHGRSRLSHWDFEIDKGWSEFAAMASLAGRAISAERRGLTRVLGGISPIDVGFIDTMKRQGVLEHVDAVAIHGSPLDWIRRSNAAIAQRIGSACVTTAIISAG
jgi:hypothetical protein